jgi:hypothetical protein
LLIRRDRVHILSLIGFLAAMRDLAGMIYGYARVSTRAQDLTGPVAQPKAAGWAKIFREKITGTTADRPHHPGS